MMKSGKVKNDTIKLNLFELNSTILHFANYFFNKTSFFIGSEVILITRNVANILISFLEL